VIATLSIPVESAEQLARWLRQAAGVIEGNAHRFCGEPWAVRVVDDRGTDGVLRLSGNDNGAS